MGLSGGFGTISAGQIWNAAYNSVGAITDQSYFLGSAYTGYRHGNALSYSVSSGAMSLQIDAILDNTTDKDMDKIELGATMNIGEIGKVAFAHIRQEDSTITVTNRIYNSVSDFRGALTIGTGTLTVSELDTSGLTVTDLDTSGLTVTDLDTSGLTVNQGNLDGNPALLVGITDLAFKPGIQSQSIPVYSCTIFKDGIGGFPAADKTVAECETLRANAEGEEGNGKVFTVGRNDLRNSDGTLKTRPLGDKIMPREGVNLIPNTGDVTIGGLSINRISKLSHFFKTGVGDTEVKVEPKIELRPITGSERCYVSVGVRNAGVDCEEYVEKYVYTNAKDEEVTVPATSNQLRHSAEVEFSRGSLGVTGGQTLVGTAGGQTLVGTADGQTLVGTATGTVSGTPKIDITTLTVETTTTHKDTDTEEPDYGYTTNAVAAQVDFLGYSAHLGLLDKKSNAPGAESRSVMHLGASGAIGDTGANFLFQVRDVEQAGGDDVNPWYVSLSKSLGSGASLIFEHANPDGEGGHEDSTSVIALKVDF